MIETDRFIAYISAQIMERELQSIYSITDKMTPKNIRGMVMSAWGLVRGSNAWNLGMESFSNLSSIMDVTAHAYWCWYTVLAIDLSNAVRETAIHHKINLPSD